MPFAQRHQVRGRSLLTEHFQALHGDVWLDAASDFIAKLPRHPSDRAIAITVYIAKGRRQRAEGKGLLSGCCSRSIGPHSSAYSYKDKIGALVKRVGKVGRAKVLLANYYFFNAIYYFFNAT